MIFDLAKEREGTFEIFFCEWNEKWDEKKLYPLSLTLEIIYKRLGMDWSIKPFLATENIWLSDIFSGYREGPVGWNSLNDKLCEIIKR